MEDTTTTYDIDNGVGDHRKPGKMISELRG